MSYSMGLYAVSLKGLAEAMGGGDEELLKRIAKDDPERFARDDGDSGRSLCDTCGHLIRRGVVPAGVEAYEVGYALELICGVLGERLDVPELAETCGEYLDGIGRKLKWASKLFRSRMPVGLPAARSFPVIGYMTHGELGEVVGAWDEGVLDRMDEELAEGAAGLINAVMVAHEGGRDLVAFYY